MKGRLLRSLAIIAFALLLVGAVLSVKWPHAGIDPNAPSSEDVSKTLFGEKGDNVTGYGLVMFLIGLLLLVALLGGVFLAKEEEK